MGRPGLLRQGTEPACCRARRGGSGGFPRHAEGLRALPGIGAYTAAAIAAIAYGEPLVPADGNVERVAARLFAVSEPLPGAKGSSPGWRSIS